MTIENMDFVVRQDALPAGVYGIITLDEVGRANIYINSKSPSERKISALKHELHHLMRGDLFSARPVADLEAECRADLSPVVFYDREGERVCL